MVAATASTGGPDTTLLVAATTSAMGYLLKPVRSEALEEALAKAQRPNRMQLASLGKATASGDDMPARSHINGAFLHMCIVAGLDAAPTMLARVPDWAGNHHEKLDGSGYPRRLSAGQLSIPERVMAIADIFEALTAADRPYKKAKTLSESLHIMSRMRDDGHICPDLFELFLRAGVYQQYAQRFLRPEQIDAVEVADYLTERG